MDRKQLLQPKRVKNEVAKKQPASKGSAARNEKQAAAILRTKAPAVKKQIADTTQAARTTRSPKVMIQALDRIRPLGLELAATEPAKAAWNGAIDTARAKWEAVPEPQGASPVKPATSRGDKQVLYSDGTFDVIEVPAPPAPFAPVPVPSRRTREQAKSTAEDAANHAGDAAHDAADHTGDAAHDAADAAADAAANAGDAAHDAADNATDHAHDAAEDGQEAGENAANTVAGWFGH